MHKLSLYISLRSWLLAALLEPLSVVHRDSIMMLCHKDYHSFSQALAKNYPVFGLICADYAAHQLTALLSQSIL